MRRFSTPPERDDARIIQAIDEFIARHPDDSEGPFLLFEAASNYIEDADRAVAILRRIVADHSGSTLERLAKARLRRHDEVGKPFLLEFKDAVTDADVSLASFKGRIVVIDFWATWCAPCVEAVPRLKDLYAQWQPLGVEFIGVSLDLPEEQGGPSPPQVLCRGTRDPLAAVLPGRRMGERVLLLLGRHLDSHRLRDRSRKPPSRHWRGRSAGAARRGPSRRSFAG